MPAMRDAFFEELYERAKNDKNIVVLSADLGAPSLDRFRLDLPSQYIFMGISEQNMILVATGLALEGKRPFCYAIAPFLTMRCFEQIRLYASGMNLPITLVGVGAGIAYEDSGYTHHAVEDIAIIRALPNLRIYLPSDNEAVSQMVDYVINEARPAYLRLDRYGIDRLYESEHVISKTYSIVNRPRTVTILSTGSAFRESQKVIETLKKEGIEVGLIDLHRLPIEIERFIDDIKETRLLVTVEEHLLSGGIGSYIAEIFIDRCIDVQLKRFGLNPNNGYFEEFGGRKQLYVVNEMDAGSVSQYIRKFVYEGKV